MSNCIVVEDNSILVPEGDYGLRCVRYETRITFAPKLYLWFQFVYPCKYEGAEIARHYNVRSIKDRPKEGGSFTVGKRSDFLREYIRVFGETNDLSTVDAENYIGQIVTCRVKTVCKCSKGKLIPPTLRYSKIEEIIGISQNISSLEKQDNQDPWDLDGWE